MSRSTTRTPARTNRRAQRRVKRSEQARGRGLRWAVTVVALAIGLGAGAATGIALRSSDVVPSVEVAEPGDVVGAALDAFGSGDHVFVAAGSEHLLDAEAEARVEAAVAEAEAPLYVLVVRPTRNAGYRSAHQVTDQLIEYGPTDAVFVVWEGGGDGYLGFRRGGSLPSHYDLEDQGITVPDGYDDIKSYEMLGTAEARLTEWAAALPPNLADYREEPNGTDQSDRVAGVVFGVLFGLVVAGVVIPVAVGLGRRLR